MNEIINYIGIDFVIVLLTAAAILINLFANPVMVDMNLEASL